MKPEVCKEEQEVVDWSSYQVGGKKLFLDRYSVMSENGLQWIRECLMFHAWLISYRFKNLL